MKSRCSNVLTAPTFLNIFALARVPSVTWTTTAACPCGRLVCVCVCVSDGQLLSCALHVYVLLRLRKEYLYPWRVGLLEYNLGDGEFT